MNNKDEFISNALSFFKWFRKKYQMNLAPDVLMDQAAAKLIAMGESEKSSDDPDHDWGSWNSYEQVRFEAGETNGFRYRRNCERLGCSAYQEAIDLVAVGNVTTKTTSCEVCFKLFEFCSCAK